MHAPPGRAIRSIGASVSRLRKASVRCTSFVDSADELRAHHRRGRVPHGGVRRQNAEDRLRPPVVRSAFAEGSLPGSPIRTPSLDVLNAGSDSAVGCDRIQSAPNLR
jgi:hypothetical protein